MALPANSQIPSLVFYHKEEEEDSVDNVDHDYSEIAKGGFLNAACIASVGRIFLELNLFCFCFKVWKANVCTPNL